MVFTTNKSSSGIHIQKSQLFGQVFTRSFYLSLFQCGKQILLRGPKSERPLNLDNLARRKVRKILTNAHIQWHGWYSLRRGIATMVHNIEKDPMAAKGLLRHASVITTQGHYIRSAGNHFKCNEEGRCIVQPTCNSAGQSP
jgi:hypothetical protein